MQRSAIQQSRDESLPPLHRMEEKAGERRTGIPKIVAGTAALSAVAAAAILFFFDPSQWGFYPACSLYTLTGWQCPGCGSTRALHQLLRGDVIAAFHHNPLLILALPVAGLVLARLLAWKCLGWPRPLRWRAAHLWMLVGAIVAFGLARNLI